MAPISTTRTLRASTLLGVLFLALAATTALAAPAAAATHSVVIEQYAYGPSALDIAQGDTVTWTNQDSVGHDVEVTQGPVRFHSPLLAQGQSWSHTFTTAGSYAYVCSVHPDMRATITVAPEAAPSPATAPAKAATSAVPTRVPSPVPAHAAPSRSAAAAPAPSPPPASTPQVAPAAAEPATQQVETVPQSTTTLDPLLLVAGLSTAVTVFCLLLMTSRPVVPAPEASPDA